MAFNGRAICTVHDEILSTVKTILKMKSKDYETIEDFKDDIDYEVEKIEDLTNEAKELGQNMENCIIDRRGVIEEAIKELKTIVISNLEEGL